ncbi:MAG: CotH kinase family protein [Saprospiraceae bacterium]|nr:CotH kinase family protein [Saprospiraceae bacterium]MDW8229095.1 CotH kinase family protein [Saprospiraceae bacterium]
MFNRFTFARNRNTRMRILTFLRLLLLVFVASLSAARGQQAASVPAPLVVKFSQPGGFYQASVEVRLSAPEGAVIYYTTDGSYPSVRSARYTRPLLVSRTTVIRALARRGQVVGRATAQTYFIGEPPTKLPIVSVAISPGILFDPEKGIFREGPMADTTAEHRPGANFWTRREFACHVEIYESDGTCVHNSGAGFRLFGGYSRIFPQKSIVLVARSRYGKKFFRHRIFGPDQPKKFKYLVLRNGGSDFAGAHFRDELMNRLTDDWGLEKQAFRPALLYLNGQYWGLYHIREKINARFLEDHADVDRDSLDLLEHQRHVRHGTNDHYLRLLEYIRTHDLAVPAHYEWVRGQMDVENFIDYQIAQIYCFNFDAGGNIRYWRPHRPGGRWRWILFDTDWGFGMHDPNAWQADAIAFFTEPNGPRWPNPPWSTFLLRNLLRNREFQQQFVNRFCDRLNTSLSAENVLREVEWFERTLGPEMPRHLQRWRRSEANWRRHVAIIRQFAQQRPAVLYQHLAQHFQTGAPAQLHLTVDVGGSVIVNNTITVGTGEFRGTYFERIPIALQAVPAVGYRFAGWEGIERQGRTIETYLPAHETLHLRARFVPDRHALDGVVFFNEIAPAGQKTGDWIELYNAGKQPVRLKGWALRDARRSWNLPDVSIAPQSYFVLCQDSTAFKKRFPYVRQIAGDFRFGLNKQAERLLLYAADGRAVDSVAYVIEAPEGEFTLDLLMPSLDNAQADNWGVHPGPGSPGMPNPLFHAQMVATEKERATRIGLIIGVLILLLGALLLRRIHTYAIGKSRTLF